MQALSRGAVNPAKVVLSHPSIEVGCVQASRDFSSTFLKLRYVKYSGSFSSSCLLIHLKIFSALVSQDFLLQKVC